MANQADCHSPCCVREWDYPVFGDDFARMSVKASNVKAIRFQNGVVAERVQPFLENED
jgi:hypothetical protein